MVVAGCARDLGEEMNSRIWAIEPGVAEVCMHIGWKVPVAFAVR